MSNVGDNHIQYREAIGRLGDKLFKGWMNVQEEVDVQVILIPNKSIGPLVVNDSTDFHHFTKKV